MANVGFIGLGTMGRPMAKNLLKAGHSLSFFARRPEVKAEFEGLGAKSVTSPAEVARRSDFVVTIVTADPQLEEVALGRGGIIEGATSDTMLIDMSTVGADTERRISERLHKAGMTMLDAPVSGGPWGAESGTLTIMVGGNADDFERAQPILTAMGKKIFHVGPLGAGQVIKLVNQMVGAGIMALLGEGFALAQKAGADLATTIDVMGVSSAASSVLEARGKKFVLADQYVPGFRCDLMRKDIALAVEMASHLNVPTPVAAAALQQYTTALHHGMGEMDFGVIAKLCAEAAGVKKG